MALIFGDSFDHYAIADLTKKWSSHNLTAPQIAAEYAMPPHGVGFYAYTTSSTGYLDKALPATFATFIAGVWFRSQSFAGAIPVLQFMDGTTEHVSVRTDTSARITFTRNGTVLATSTNTLNTNTWYHLEVKATIGDAADTPSGQYEVRVGGTATGWIPDSGTGQDTRNAGNQYVTNVRLSSRGGNYHQFQDYYFLDTTGAVANDFLGPCRFAVLRPVGVGNSAQWTGNYADNFLNVADQYADGDSTFNQDSTAGHIDLFQMSDVPAGTVHAVQHVYMARQDAGAARSIRAKVRIAGSNYNGTTVALAGSHVFYLDPMNVSPATSAQWDDDELNAMEAGYELVS